MSQSCADSSGKQSHRTTWHSSFRSLHLTYKSCGTKVKKSTKVLGHGNMLEIQPQDEVNG